MGEGNQYRSRTRRGEKSSVVIPEKNEGFGNLTMKEIVAAKKREVVDLEPKKQKNKASQEIKELEALIPILEKMDHEEESPTPEISKTEKEAAPDDSLELNDIKKKKIAYLEAELERQKKLLEFEKSKNSSEEMIKTIENHIKLTEETLNNLKNAGNVPINSNPETPTPIIPTPVVSGYSYADGGKPEIPTPAPETAPAATDEDKKTKTLAELKRTLRETIENAKKELAEIQKELKEIDARELARKTTKELEKKQKATEELAMRTETFSTDFIEEKIKLLLSTNKSIKEIKNVEVKGNGSEIQINLEITGKKGFISVNIDANMILKNEGTAIGIKNHQINASNFQSMIEGAISPELGKVPALVKSYIEKESGKKVEKIWIEGGELKVVFT